MGDGDSSSQAASRKANRALVVGLVLTLIVASGAALVAHRATHTFLGAVAGWCSVVIVLGFLQFLLVMIGAARGVRRSK